MTCLDDDMVLGLVEGRLAPPVLATVDEHLDTCATCRDVVTQVARSLSPPTRTLERGQTVGRYVIGDLVGEGAMGRVYSAWEPELDRRVALKLLSASDAGARDRMVREAKSMAKLDHPNVVGVHEVGTADDAIYVAMELVDGDTLRAYSSTPHPWRETAALLADIARGLAAVHAAGVIHRDVKPDNIIVGRDHRARIGDFGLARADSPPTSPPPETSFALGSQATALAGTPAYMAPEVANGESATAASDQFSFGVTAYESLAGHRPYDATTFAKLREAYKSSSIAPLRDVPAWLDAAIRRCLSIDPSARFSSLVDFADIVTRGLHRRQGSRLLVGGIAAAALVASGATYIALRQAASGPSCSAGDTGIASTWNASKRAQLAHIGEPALRALDAWTRAWADERNTTCRAAEYEPPTMTAARNRCLDRRRDEAAALIGALSSETKPNYTLVDSLAALPAPDECAAAATDPADAIPIDPTRAAIVLDIQQEIASLRAKLALGDARPLVDATTKLVESSRASQHAPTIAEAELLHADALRATSQLDAAVDAVRAAAADAERGHADQLAARIWLARVAIAGDRRDLASADDLIAIASGAIDRAGAPKRLVATLLKHRGLVAYNRGQYDEARKLLTEAHAILAGLSKPATSGTATPESSGVAVGTNDLAATIERISVESSLGSVERAAGNLDSAEQWHQRALDADRALRGDVHPDIARDLHNLAGVARLRGDLDLAFQRYSKALEIEIATRGEKSVEAGLTHNSLGLVALAHAQQELARTRGAPAGDALENPLGPPKGKIIIDPRTAPDGPGSRLDPDTRVEPDTPGARAIADVRGYLHAARAQFTLARDILTAANHGDRAFAIHNLGLVDAAEGDHVAAIAQFDLAMALYKQTIGISSDAAKRLEEDRTRSMRELALARLDKSSVKHDRPPRTNAGVEPVTTTIQPQPPVPDPPPPPKRDVGVYGSTQSW